MMFECIDCGRIVGSGDGPEPYVCEDCCLERLSEGDDNVQA